jgi:general secretion pathway protein I
MSDVIQHQQATWLAESLLASHSNVGSTGWNEDGESAGFNWQVRSSPYNSGVNSPLAVPLHAIRLSISWGAGSRPGQLDLVTLLPERKPQPGEVVR